MNARLLDTGLLEQAKRIRADLVAIRRAIHARPEFGFEEHETAALIAERLTAIGARVQRGVARTGVVSELGCGGPIVAIRADMDALPIAEATGLPFASRIPGMMHACGHDAHVTCALGAAMLLAGQPISGVVGPHVPDPVWHSPTFDIDEDALPVGAAVLAAAAVRLLETQR